MIDDVLRRVYVMLLVALIVCGSCGMALNALLCIVFIIAIVRMSYGNIWFNSEIGTGPIEGGEEKQ